MTWLHWTAAIIGALTAWLLTEAIGPAVHRLRQSSRGKAPLSQEMTRLLLQRMIFLVIATAVALAAAAVGATGLLWR